MPEDRLSTASPSWRKVLADTLFGPLGVPGTEPEKAAEELRQKFHEWVANTTPEQRGMTILDWTTNLIPVKGAAAVGAVPVLGMLKGVEPKVAKVIRKAMREEFANRGPRVGKKFAEPLGELLDRVLEGPWFHGRKTYPEPGASFFSGRARPGNFGEPSGISLTAHPELLENSFAKEAPLVKQKEGNFIALDFFSGMPFARVLPRLGDRPSKVILPGWMGEGTEEANKVLWDAYTKVAKSQGFYDPGELFEFYSKAHQMTDAYKYGAKIVNKELTQQLQQRGYKGILYSPHRYDEWELRMFDPADVMMLDFRTSEETGLKTLFPFRFKAADLASAPEKASRRARTLSTWAAVTPRRGQGGSLKDIYKFFSNQVAPKENLPYDTWSKIAEEELDKWLSK